MLKKTQLKAKNSQFKKTPLKSGSKGLKVNSHLKKSGNLNIITFTAKRTSLKQTTHLQNKGTELAKNTELKKQNDKAKEKWQEVRQKVIERDGGKCVVCGKPGTHVHHIHLRSKRKDLLYEMNNLVLLCSKHHDHTSIDGLYEVNERIARAKHMTLEELLKFAETKSEE